MKKDIQNKDFNLQVDFKVKAAQESTDDILVIEGIANYFGTAKGEDYSQVYIDRAGETVVPSGMDLKWFKKNPVILHNHDRNKVIGKALSVTRKDDGIYLKAEVHKGACDEEVFYAIQNGLLRTFSIGFACKAGEYKEINNRNVYFITKSELREVSVVTIPCSTESMFELKSLAGEEGFYAEDETTDKGTDVDMPTHSNDVHKSTDGDNTMKIALKELLSAAEVDRFKSLGLEASLDEEKEISTKQYIDQLVAKSVAEAFAAAELEKAKAATEEQEKGEEQSEEAQEGSEEETKSDEGSEDAGTEEVKSVPEEVTKSLTDLSAVIEKLKADISAE